MKLYFAPLEGITGYIYRNAYYDFFGKGVDKFFTPFIGVGQNGLSKSRIWEDIATEHNKKMTVVPQLLSNNGNITKDYVNQLADLGYQEINLNLGCPYQTVVSKKKGAGLLAEPERLVEFLDELFEGMRNSERSGVKTAHISVKTRIGMTSSDEFERLLEIYNQYPLSELIIHPRVREEFYDGHPHLESFALALEYSKAPVCYNGDIFTKKDYQNLVEQFPKVDRVMLGRGPLSNPGLISELLTGEKATKEQLLAFHNRLYADYLQVMSGEKNTLFKMKELWNYMQFSFKDCEKQIKKIRKAQRASEYEAAVRELFTGEIQ